MTERELTAVEMALTGVRIFAVFAATLHSHSICGAGTAAHKIVVILENLDSRATVALEM